MKRSFKIIIALLCTCLLLLCLLIGWLLFKPSSPPAQALLRSTGIQGEAEIIDYVRWHDPLRYTHGYEIVAAQMPEGWILPELPGVRPVAKDELLELYGWALPGDAWKNMSIQPTEGAQYFLSDGNMTAEDYDDREFRIIFQETDNLLFIYRGHHLYGELQ